MCTSYFNGILQTPILQGFVDFSLNPYGIEMAYCQSSSTALSKCGLMSWLIDRAFEKGTKTIQCIDCGVEVEVPRMSKRTCRCSDCQNKHNQEYERIKKAKQRAK